VQPAYFKCIIQKPASPFKGNISIDKADSGAYGTIISQALQTKRLTAAKFFEKIFQKGGCGG